MTKRFKDQVLTINTYWHDINGWRSDFYREGGDFVQLRKDVREWDPEKGDKLEMRMRQNQWADISDNVMDREPSEDSTGADRLGASGFWFDYPFGKLYVWTRLYQTRANSLRISYRYGSTEAVPAAINRLCCLLTATQILNMQFYNIKVGAGGDIDSVRGSMLNGWQNEMNSIWSSYQRSGSVHSLLR